jgi:F-type H+-transporting ATPase subunit a
MNNYVSFPLRSPFEEARIFSIFSYIFSTLSSVYSHFHLPHFDFSVSNPMIANLSSILVPCDESCAWSDLRYSYSYHSFTFVITHIKYVLISGLFLSEQNYGIVVLFVCLSISFFLFSSNRLVITASQEISHFVYYSMVLPYLGNSGKRYSPFFSYLFLFIFISNFMGSIPGFFAVTSQLSVTFFLSSICWFSILFVGIYYHGMRFFSIFYPSKVPFVSSPFPMCIEFLSYIVRLASLASRLFANIVAGHISSDTISMFSFYLDTSVESTIQLEFIFVGLFPWVLLFIMILFELSIALSQAYIFVVPAVIYLNDSIHLHDL